MSLLAIERHNGVLVLTLNDPDRRNILSGELCSLISAAMAEASEDQETRAVAITGFGAAFCAGADLAALEAASRGDSLEVDAVYKAFVDVAQSPLPTVAAVNGPAVGAGFNLALACDMRIAAPTARFDTRFLKLGLHPGGGHAWLLIRAIGWSAASKLLMGGKSVDADEAFRLGLVQEIAPIDELSKAAIALFEGLADRPRELVLRTKATMRHAVTCEHAAAFAHETAEQRWSLGEPAFAASVARARQR